MSKPDTLALPHADRIDGPCLTTVYTPHTLPTRHAGAAVYTLEDLTQMSRAGLEALRDRVDNALLSARGPE